MTVLRVLLVSCLLHITGVAGVFCYTCRMVEFSDLMALRDWRSHLGNVDCARPPEDGAGLDLVKCPVMDVTQACVYMTFNITGSTRKGAPSSTATVRMCASVKQLGCRSMTEQELKDMRHEMDAIKGAYQTLGPDSVSTGGQICACRTNRCRPDAMDFRLSPSSLYPDSGVAEASEGMMTTAQKLLLWILPHIVIIVGGTVLLMSVFSLFQRKQPTSSTRHPGGMFPHRKH